MDADAGGRQSSWALALLTVPQLQECLQALAERSQRPWLRPFQWAAEFVAAPC